MNATPIWRRLFMQAMPWALDLDLPRAGSSMPARMAMIAMTTRSSMRVNPRWTLRRLFMGRAMEI